ncbi:MAG: prenyltransferase, partial [Kiritimatiellia bacterium]
MRPWSLTATVAPIGLAAAVAWRDGFSDWLVLGLMVVSGCALQLAVNLRNTFVDWREGVDADRAERRCCVERMGAIGRLAVVMLVVGALGGLAVAALTSWYLVGCVVLGTGGAWYYTSGWFKYQGMGVFGVYLLMGLVEPLAAYWALARRVSPEMVWLSLPIAFLVAAILHANDLRDFRRDSDAGIRTLSIRLGRRGARWLYAFLV